MQFYVVASYFLIGVIDLSPRDCMGLGSELLPASVAVFPQTQL